jgi:hypothetical protein
LPGPPWGGELRLPSLLLWRPSWSGRPS